MGCCHEVCITLPEYTVKAVIYGDADGLPVIALHGWLDNAASFYAVGEYLEGIKLISLDLIGHGRSSYRPDGMPYHIWDNITDLYQILEQLEIDKTCLVGHSMGASIAMLFAGTFPDRIQHLMAIDGLVPLAYDVDSLPELLSDAIVKREKMASRNLKPYKTEEDAVSARMNGRWPVSREAAERLLDRGLAKTDDGYIWSNDPRLLMPSLVRFSPDQIRIFLKAVKAQTTVIRASNGASNLIDGWVGELSSAELIDMQGGHHLHLEPHCAKEIASLLNSWV